MVGGGQQIERRWHVLNPMAREWVSRSGEPNTRRSGGALHQSKSCSLITDGIVRNTLPDEGLQSFPMVLGQVHISHGKLTA